MEYPREEIEAAFRHHRHLNDTQQWDAYADLFTDDGIYVEHEMGTFRGREAIRAWIVPCMAPLVNAGWDYPLDWSIIDGRRETRRSASHSSHSSSSRRPPCPHGTRSRRRRT